MSEDGQPTRVRRAEMLAIGEAGRAAYELGPGPPTRFPDSSDHELSEFEVPGAQVRAASVRGLMHRYHAQPRQDRFSVVFDPRTTTLVVVVCDGVGQFALSQEAAAFVAADAPRAFLVHRDWTAAIDEVNRRLAEFVAQTGARTHLDAPPKGARMATTVAAAAVSLAPGEHGISLAWSDDSSVWTLARGVWTNLTPSPTSAEDADSGLYSGRVQALPNANLRLSVAQGHVGDGALFVFSDGIGVPLEGSDQVREALAAWWATPPDAFTFGQQAGFARKGHMDDRTAVGVWFDPP